MEGTYKRYKGVECVMQGVHDFTCYLKRGYGRSTWQASLDVRNGLLTRQEAFELIKKHDNEIPEALNYFLKLADMEEEEFYNVIEGLKVQGVKGITLPTSKRQTPLDEDKSKPFIRQLIDELRSSNDQKNKSNNLFYDNNINQLHSLIKNKEISYIDVIKETIKKTIEFDPKYHLWASFDEKELLSHIDNKRMPTSSDNDLTGIPVAVKDIFNTITLPTQMGSPLWKDFNAGNDARVVSNLKEAGAIVAGKTVTAEFAVHALNETLNPHDILLTPGTSSSGSAVAIAMGVCPVALATQTAGSIVRPASFNGIYGYKPSFGLVPRTGMLKTTDTLDTVGFFTIHYKDILKVFEAIRVKGKNYPISNEALTDKNRQYKDKSRPWRVAFLKLIHGVMLKITQKI